MKRKATLLLLVPLLTLTSCRIIDNSSSSTQQSSSTSTNTGNSSTSSSSSSKPVEPIEKPDNLQDWVQKQYSYTFYSTDSLEKGGGTRIINSLEYSWTALPYSSFGSGKGLQFGSGSSPVTSPWTINFSFKEDVYIARMDLYLSVASSGNGLVDLKCGNYVGEQINFRNTTPASYLINPINQITSDFSLTFQSKASKAMYLYKMEIDLLVNPNSSLNFDHTVPERDPVVPGKNDILATKYELIDKEAYYQGVNLEQTGDALRKTLNTLLSSMTVYSYDQARYILPYTDENPYKKGYLYSLYDGDDLLGQWDGGKSWNREHVWACAHMNINNLGRPDGSTRNHTTDLHNLRACSKDTNEFHSDKYYDLTQSANFMFPNVTQDDVAGIHNFVGDHRGDVARVLFYMYSRYTDLYLVDDVLNAANQELTMGKLSLLLEWNKQDPVDDFEIQRNNRIYQYQGNRNPFIDYPELADKLFEVA